METRNLNGIQELLEAQAHIWKYGLNYITFMSLKCAVELGIPDIISNHAKAITLAQLVKEIEIPQTKSTQLSRLMRILVHSSFFAVENVSEDQEGYVLTPSTRLLLKNQNTNLSEVLLMLMHPIFITSCHSMSSWFKGTDSSPFEVAYGMNLWNYLGQNSGVSESFNAAMASDSEFVMSILVKEYKEMFEGFNSLVDVGGGTGTVVKAISKAFPLLKCTVYDLPQVVNGMEGSKNIEFVGGDMLHFVPSADIILLKMVLHDWDDVECVKILKRCKEAISKDREGKLIIIDMVIDENDGKHASIRSQLCLDILMLVLLNGKERTEAEWEKLFVGAGFSSYKITHGLGLRSIIEVFR